MKYFVHFSRLICLMLLSAGCKKSSNNVEQNKLVSSGYVVTDSTSLNGYWELRVLFGCQTPNCNPYFSPGNGNTWYFTDSTYKYTVVSKSPQYTASDSARYILGRDICPATSRLMDFFKPEDDPYGGFFLKLRRIHLHYTGELLPQMELSRNL